MCEVLLLSEYIFTAVVFLLIGYTWGNTVGYTQGSKEERARWQRSLDAFRRAFIGRVKSGNTDKPIKPEDLDLTV